MEEQKKDNADKSIDTHKKSTTQGGSNFGQGSAYLAGDAYKQGRETNEGSNYENEAGKFSEDEPLRKDDEGTETMGNP